LKKEPRSSASRKSLARQGHQAAMRRGKADRTRSAKKAARTRKSTTGRTRRSRAT
jgi:hypothetical protein